YFLKQGEVRGQLSEEVPRFRVPRGPPEIPAANADGAPHTFPRRSMRWSRSRASQLYRAPRSSAASLLTPSARSVSEIIDAASIARPLLFGHAHEPTPLRLMLD